MRDFFVSYTKVDEHWAEWIAWQLEEVGFEVMIQAWDFRPGESFVVQMDRAASQCGQTLAVLSSSYLESGFAMSEWAAAFSRDPTGSARPVIPIRVDECDLGGRLLGQTVYIDLVGLPEEEAREALLKGVRAGRVKPEQEPEFPCDGVPSHQAVTSRPAYPLAAPEIDPPRQPRWAWWVVGLLVPIAVGLAPIVWRYIENEPEAGLNAHAPQWCLWVSPRMDGKHTRCFATKAECEEFYELAMDSTKHTPLRTVQPCRLTPAESIPKEP